ncbi:MAG: hypothetical protein AAF432_02035 [Planctomycetota bacterium]
MFRRLGTTGFSLLAVALVATAVSLWLVQRPDREEVLAERLRIIQNDIRLGMSVDEVMTLLSEPDGEGMFSYVAPSDFDWEPSESFMRATKHYSYWYELPDEQAIDIVFNMLDELIQIKFGTE